MSSELTPQLREQIENTIRFLAVDAVQKANSGHPGAPMGLASVAFELWNNHLRFDPSDPAWPLRDRFVLSGGHASMLIYSLLHLFGYDLSLDDIRAFRQLGSKTPGHPEYGDTPGVEVTTGPLGQGFAHAVGMALAGRLTQGSFGADAEGPGRHLVYGLMGDGDMMEGVSYEAASLAGHLGLGNLIFLYDDNRITIDGGTQLSFSEDVGGRFEAQGWHVQKVDGEDLSGLRAALGAARGEARRPSLIITRTVIGKGSDKIAGTSKAHGAPLGAEEVQAAKQKAGWPLEDFVVPQEVLDYCLARGDAKQRERKEIDGRFDAWCAAHPEQATAWKAARDRSMPENLGELLVDGMEGVEKATRALSGMVLEKLSDLVPYMVGGSADLAGSAAPPILKSKGIVGPGAGEGQDPFAGGNIHFGVREHTMGAICNGIALDGTFIPYCGTFLIFSDYLRPSLRLAAIMGARSIFVFTHDSFFVGEDGPTHQPVEQLDALRAIPGLNVFRPADGVETAMAYAWILQKAEGPALLSLTRQGVKAPARDASFRLEDVWRGAYLLQEPEGDADVILMASGSELGLAVDAAQLLGEQGIRSKVVSAPCLELFMDQPEAYRRSLLPEDGLPVVAVEAGVGESFRRFVGSRGLIYGLQRFGASAPAEDLAQEFGFTPDQLAARVRTHLGR